MYVVIIHDNQFQSNQSKTICSLFLYLMMLYMKFDYIWSTDMRDILLGKCEWTTNGWTDGLGMPDYCHANTSL